MNKTVKAKYANGALMPLERLDLAEDSVVLLTIEELPADESEPDEAGHLGVSADSEPLIDMSGVSLEHQPVSKKHRLSIFVQPSASLSQVHPTTAKLPHHAVQSRPPAFSLAGVHMTG